MEIYIVKPGDSIESIAEKHYDKLIKWLQETNAFAEKIYTSEGEMIGLRQELGESDE
jgi:hypothetical protein